MTDNVRPVKAALEQSPFGTFDAVWNALNFSYSLIRIIVTIFGSAVEVSRPRAPTQPNCFGVAVKNHNSPYESSSRQTEPRRARKRPVRRDSQSVRRRHRSADFVAPAREHFKTLYFQWKFINLSRALLYVSVPALIVTGLIITAVDATSVPGQTPGVDNLVVLTSFGFTVGIALFVVFIVSLLRIVTVAERTLAMGPFVLRKTQHRGETE